MPLSTRLDLPLLSPGQAQKEVTHNEALLLLDHLVAASVEDPPRQSPPSSPVVGSTYIIGDAPTGSWSQYAQHLAAFTSGGWRFVSPTEGLRAIVRTSGLTAVFRGTAWQIGTVVGTKLILDGQQVVGARGPAVANPAGGGVVDIEARNAIFAVLDRLRTHGLIA